MTATAWILTVLAILFIALGAYPAGLFLCIAAGLVALLGPSDEQRDARERNHARRMR